MASFQNKGNQVDVPAVTTPFLAPVPNPGPAITWFRFLQMLWKRTGSHDGIDGAALTRASNDTTLLLLSSVSPAKTARPLPIPITIGASVFTYTAPYDGWVVINGGTVSLVQFSRDGGSTLFAIAGSLVPVCKGDQVKVTYSVIPTTMTMIGS